MSDVINFPGAKVNDIKSKDHQRLTHICMYTYTHVGFDETFTSGRAYEILALSEVAELSLQDRSDKLLKTVAYVHGRKKNSILYAHATTGFF